MGVCKPFEGIDGCGKSTQAKLLYEYLVKQKIATVCIRVLDNLSWKKNK
ncbi:hypothetical protein [Bacillus tropicus]